MIVTAASNLIVQRERLASNELVLNRVTQTCDTKATLEELGPAVAELTQTFANSTDRLRPEDRDRIEQRLYGLRQLIAQSRTRFLDRGDLRQVNSLRDAQSSTRDIADDLDVSWRQVTEQSVSGYRDLLTIARQFPGMERDVDALQRGVAEFRSIAGKAPRTPQRRNTIEHQLEELAVLARAFDSLPSPVRAFLDQVANGDATLEHLEPSTLRWLTDHGHLAIFSIRFSGGTR